MATSRIRPLENTLSRMSGKLSGRKPSPAELPKVPSTHRSPIAAAQAKTHLLALISQVELNRTPIVITRRGRAIARIVPIEEDCPPDIFGCMKGTGRIIGDIVGPEPDAWEATSE